MYFNHLNQDVNIQEEIFKVLSSLAMVLTDFAFRNHYTVKGFLFLFLCRSFPNNHLPRKVGLFDLLRFFNKLIRPDFVHHAQVVNFEIMRQNICFVCSRRIELPFLYKQER